MTNPQASRPRISVITVVFNGEKVIDQTLQSVAMQDSRDHEYIVIDGASRDKTLDAVRAAAQRGLVTDWISERDAGIYDAMNKGVRRARGDYVYFLNAGDTFHAPDVLSRASHLLQNNPAVLVGRVAVQGGRAPYYPVKFDETIKADARKLFAEHFCHQALFVRRTDLLAAGCFSLKYPRLADFHNAWRVMLNGYVSDASDLIVSNFSVDGVSSDWRLSIDIYKERENLFKEIGFDKSLVSWVLGYIRASLYVKKMSILAKLK